MNNKDVELILKDITKSQEDMKNVLEIFGFENKINLNAKKILIKKVMENIKNDNFDIETFKSLLEKIK